MDWTEKMLKEVMTTMLGENVAFDSKHRFKYGFVIAFFLWSLNETFAWPNVEELACLDKRKGKSRIFFAFCSIMSFASFKLIQILTELHMMNMDTLLCGFSNL